MTKIQRSGGREAAPRPPAVSAEGQRSPPGIFTADSKRVCGKRDGDSELIAAAQTRYPNNKHHQLTALYFNDNAILKK